MLSGRLSITAESPRSIAAAATAAGAGLAQALQSQPALASRRTPRPVRGARS